MLAILLTYANEVVSADRLIDELWSGQPPETAANALQGYVARLRKVLGRDVIATRPPGYVIQLDPDQLDLRRFERLTDEARGLLAAGYANEAAARLREALSLWRGDPLADFATEPFAQAEIARLEELRLAALERRIAADLEVGRHAEVIAELESLVSRYPLRERLRAHLIVALYRAGRQADALEAYQDARRALVDGLGIEPSPWLREVERAVLRHDPSLAPARVAPGPAAAAAEGSILVIPWSDTATEVLVALAQNLAASPVREVIVARLVRDERDLAAAAREVERCRDLLASAGIGVRAAAFTSPAPAEDVVLLAGEQEADVLLTDVPPRLLADGVPDADFARVLHEMPCDVAAVATRGATPIAPDPERPVLVPFGGAEHEWAAVEIGAWIARAYRSRLKLVGTLGEPGTGTRDASRLLARAALMIQRVAAVPTEPQLVARGEAGVLEAAETAGIAIVGLSSRWRHEGLGRSRLAVLRDARPPAVLVRRGPRPGGLAPRETLTRFTWTAAGRN